MFNDFLSLIFPQVCYACGRGLLKKENCICLHCFYNLPKTDFHLKKDNPVTKLFWGRTNVQSAASLYEFNEGGKVQNLIHHRKYKGKKEIGFSLGKYYGHLLKTSSMFSCINVIVPVPLHKKTLKKRGYNQSEYFAKGIGEAMEIEIIDNVLIKTATSSSQTKKSRFNRWRNVQDIFTLSSPEKLKGKHILLVDDVVTTGSTIDACTQQLLSITDVKVSAVTIAAALIH